MHLMEVHNYALRVTRRCVPRKGIFKESLKGVFFMRSLKSLIVFNDLADRND